MKPEEITLLYGSEFWDCLESLCKIAKERAIFASAYVNLSTVKKYRSFLSKDVIHYLIARNDNKTYNLPDSNLILVDSTYFHSKIYLIDEYVIIGSQNLYDAEKEGEFNVLFKFSYNSASTVFYQSLIKIIEDDPVTPEPVNRLFLDLYDIDSTCPFCNNEFSDPASIYLCPGYGDGTTFVSESDCEGYNNIGYCKYCLVENRIPIPSALCCDDSGCGFGINTSTLTLLHHAINPPKDEKLKKAQEFLRLFNLIHRSLGNKTIEFFEALELRGQVYSTPLKRKPIQIS